MLEFIAFGMFFKEFVMPQLMATAALLSSASHQAVFQLPNYSMIAAVLRFLKARAC